MLWKKKKNGEKWNSRGKKLEEYRDSGRKLAEKLKRGEILPGSVIRGERGRYREELEIFTSLSALKGREREKKDTGQRR